MFYGYTRNRKKEESQLEEEKSGGLEEDDTSLYRYDWRGGELLGKDDVGRRGEVDVGGKNRSEGWERGGGAVGGQDTAGKVAEGER